MPRAPNYIMVLVVSNNEYGSLRGVCMHVDVVVDVEEREALAAERTRTYEIKDINSDFNYL